MQPQQPTRVIALPLAPVHVGVGTPQVVPVLDQQVNLKDDEEIVKLGKVVIEKGMKF